MPRKALSRPWTADDDALLLALAREGTPQPVIARRMSRTRGAVNARLAFLRGIRKGGSVKRWSGSPPA